MKPIIIEFFHDVICSFCFPMSYRMRQLQAALPHAKILHRSFALVWQEEDLDQMFGDRGAAKEEILTHWARANLLDDLGRFNIPGMRRANFPFPTSVLPLLACEAARRTAGEAGYWDMFDALQHAFFSQSQNIGDPEVVERCAHRTHLCFDHWLRYYHDPATRGMLEQDLRLVEQYGIRQVPTLVINGTQLLEDGAVPLPQLMARITALAAH